MRRLVFALLLIAATASALPGPQESDAVVVSAGSSGDSTREGRIFTGNQQNDNVVAAGIVGLGLGVGGVLLTQAVLDADKGKRCKRDLDAMGRLLGLGGGDRDCYYPPGDGYHHREPAYRPHRPNYRPVRPHRPDYHRPEPDYHRPRPDYHRPRPDYHRPRPDYDRPRPDYHRPRPDYDRPSRPQHYRPSSSYREPDYHDDYHRPSYSHDDHDYRHTTTRRPYYRPTTTTQRPVYYRPTKRPIYYDSDGRPYRGRSSANLEEDPVEGDNVEDLLKGEPDKTGGKTAEEVKSSRVRFVDK